MTEHVSRTTRRTAAALVAQLVSLALAVPPALGQPPASLDQVDGIVRTEMARQHIPGLAVAIVKGGEPVLVKGYGLANVEHDAPVTPETVFESGSIGKQFTAAAVMLQVEAGRLSLDDPISTFFPGAPAAWRAIKVRHLLTHTSGIPDYTVGTFDYRRDYEEGALVREAMELKPEFPAGTRWNYSNTGYVLLGVIVHTVSGRFYGDVLQERVFTPLGMPTARVISEAAIVKHRAAGYEWREGVLENQDWVSPTLNTTADGSLYLSLRDYLAWDAAVRGRKVLSAASWAQVLQPVRLASGTSYPYGFGWGISERGGAPLHAHGGSWQGFQTQYSRFIGDDLSIVVLANLAQADPGHIADLIAATLNPALAEPALTPIEDRDPAITARAEALLQRTRARTLRPADFAYLRAGFFPDGPSRYATLLATAGPTATLVLLDRHVLGDDTVSVYDVVGPTARLRLTVALAPDGKVAVFSLRAAEE
ncbi:MAG: serine hydrolase domain-containing protein [Vicinamibacterales bacterium]